MRCRLYVNTAENNRVDKTSFLQLVQEVDGYLRDASSVITPVIQFELPNQSDSLVLDEDDEQVVGEDADVVVDSTLAFSFNYIFIEDFNRYYFVQDIIIRRSNFFIVNLICDVLFSFKNDLLSLNALIDRNEFDFNEFLEDSLIPIASDKTITETNVTDDYGEVNTTLSAVLAPSLNTISFATASNAGHAKPISGFDDIAPSINPKNFTSSGGTRLFALKPNDAYRLMNDLLMNLTQYSSWVKSLVAFPFPLDVDCTSNVEERIFITDFADMETIQFNVDGKRLMSQSSYRIIADFNLPNAYSYLDLNPYSHYELYIPFFGYHELDFNKCAGHRIRVYYSINYEDGSGEVYIADMTRKVLLFSSPCQIGVPLSLSYSNAQEIKTQKQVAENNAILSIIGSGLSSLASMGSGNSLGTTLGALGMVNGVVQYNNAISQMWVKAQSTHNGSVGALYSPMKVRLRITKSHVLDGFDYNRFAHDRGRLTQVSKFLYELRGYTIVSEIHLENINAFKREKDEIERLLKIGVIL